jgi:hypothetical protein
VRTSLLAIGVLPVEQGAEIVNDRSHLVLSLGSLKRVDDFARSAPQLVPLGAGLVTLTDRLTQVCS